MLMLVHEVLANNKTVTYSQDLFLCPKLKTPMKEKRLAKIKQIKVKSKQKLLAIPKSAFRKYFEDWKTAGISVLYLRGITLMNK